MLQALQIMSMAAVIAVVTSFLISLLIQLLCRIVRMGTAKPAEDDGARIALAIAVALKQREKLG